MLDPEIAKNAEQFRAGLSAKLSDNVTAVVGSHASKIDEAYARLTSLQAWRSFVLDEHISQAALGFYSEAQNDGLTSSVLVSSGLWRPAMKSLRSMIENTIQCLFFMDHPVEARQWDDGKYRPAFKDLFDYLTTHPDIVGLPEALKSPLILKTHYSHLSNVVHASAREFRMTTDLEKSNLWKTTADGVGKWAATQKNVLRDINLLLLPMFSTHLQGAANKGLREALSTVIPAARDAAIRTALGVRILR
jgi:hypothetical protein